MTRFQHFKNSGTVHVSSKIKGLLLTAMLSFQTR